MVSFVSSSCLTWARPAGAVYERRFVTDIITGQREFIDAARSLERLW